MGYYSNVLIKVAGDSASVNQLMAELLISSPVRYNTLVKRFDITTEDNLTTFRFNNNNVKWYTHFDEVTSIESLWHYLEQTTTILNGIYITIGEELGDIRVEHINDGFSLAEVSVNINEY